MCEQTPVDYKNGDVVWVKLGPCWWPGEVVSPDKLPTDIVSSFKKLPLAIIKFFEEENFQYVKNLSQIYSYNCTRKNEFIEKGLEMHRAKHSFMEKFPGDVCIAESKTDGNPNILNDPTFRPKKRLSYSSIFGSPTKKVMKDSPIRNKRHSTGRIQSSSSQKKTPCLVTHPRFIGKDDHEVRVLVQPSGKQADTSSEYTCHTCGFKSSRIDVIVLHNKSHITGVFTSVYTPRKTKRSPVRKSPKKLKIARSKTVTIEEDIALLEKGLPLCSSDSSSDESVDVPVKAKRKPKVKSAPKPKKPKVVEPEIKKDIRSDLLAEWDDDDEDEEEQPKVPSKPQEELSTIEPESGASEKDEKVNENSAQETENDENVTDPKVTEKEEFVKEGREKSCFDFEEDEDHHIITAPEGRKIPRVIPPTGKRKSTDVQDLEEFESSNTTDKQIEETKNENPNLEAQLEAFSSVLDATAVPAIPDVPQTFKSEQNFHNAKTIKFPDKPEERKSEVATKLTNPKKRFAKTFEDETKNSNKEEKKDYIEFKSSEKIEEHLKTEVDIESDTSHPKKIVELEVNATEEIAPVESKSSRDSPAIKPSEIPISIKTAKENKLDDKLRKKNKRRQSHEIRKFNVEPFESKELDATFSEEIEKCDVKSLKSLEEIDDFKVTTTETGEFNKRPQDDVRKISDKILEKIEKRKANTFENKEEKSPPLEVAKLKTQLMSKLKLPGKNVYGKYGAYESYRHKDRTDIYEPKISEPRKRVSLAKYRELRKSKPSKNVSETVVETTTTKTDIIEDSVCDLKVQHEEIKDVIVSVDTNETQKNLIVEEMLSNLIAESILPKKQSLILEPVKNLENERILEDETLKIVEEEKTETALQDYMMESQQFESHIEKKISNSFNQPWEITVEKKIESVDSNVEIPITDKDDDKKDVEEINFEENLQNIDTNIEPEPITDIISKPIVDEVESEQSTHKIVEAVEMKMEPKLVDMEPMAEKIEQEHMDNSESELFIDKIDSEPTVDKIESEPFVHEIEREPIVDQTEPESIIDQTEPESVIDQIEPESIIDQIESESIVDKLETEGSIENTDHLVEDSSKHTSNEDEMVSMEGNLTVVSEIDLADKQVEITTNITQPKPITLSSFSMDFCEEKVEEPDEDTLPNKLRKHIGNHEIWDKETEKGEKHDTKAKQGTSIDFEELIPINYNLKNVDAKPNELFVEEIIGKSIVDTTPAENVTCEIASNAEDDKPECGNEVEEAVETKLNLLTQDISEKEIDSNENVSEGMKMKECEEQVYLDKDMYYDKVGLLNEIEIERKEIGDELHTKIETSPSPELLIEEQILEQEVEDDPKNFPIEIPETILEVSRQSPEMLKEKNKHASHDDKTSAQKVKVSILDEEMPFKKDEVRSKKDLKESLKKKRKRREETFLSLESEVAKITDTNTESEVMVKDVEESTSSTKLLEILTDKPKVDIKNKKSMATPSTSTKPDIQDNLSPKISSRFEKNEQNAKMLLKSAIPGTSRSKPVILSEKIIKPMSESEKVSVKKVTSKRSYQDVEDIDTFIIHKPAKKVAVSEIIPDATNKMSAAPKGKARILQQTIITPSGDIIQPTVNQNQSDDNMFDINAMPIILGDQILTPESMDAIPSISLQESNASVSTVKKNVLSSQVKLLNKCPTPTVVPKDKTPQSLVKLSTPSKQGRVHKVYQSSGTKLSKSSPTIITHSGKPGKYMIVSTNAPSTGSKYTVGKRQPLAKRVVPVAKPQIPEPTGNKIMVVTDNQGQQQRIVLTPSQQKLLASQGSTARIKTSIKGNILQKVSKESPVIKGANIISQTIVNSKGQVTTLANQTMTTSTGQIMSSVSSQQARIDTSKFKRISNQKVYTPGTKPSGSGVQRTIIIKNPHGQTLKRIHGTDESHMDQQVAEQIKAINRATPKMQQKDFSLKTRTPVKKSYGKRPIIRSSLTSMTTPSTSKPAVPPLAPISPTKKVETIVQPEEVHPSPVPPEDKMEETKRTPHQLVFQDGFGNQTTIIEGQILALPSEAVDGQPQSYVLVTLDETGNLAPLTNEALMSLDPNLNLGGDLGNMVLQIEQGTSPESNTPTQPKTPEITTDPSNILPQVAHEELIENKTTTNETLCENISETLQTNVDANVQAVAVTSGEMGQQFIITGDPIAAQKFLETLTEGNTDLANLLANAEGNMLIQAEGQQILINTDSDNQMLLTMNPENLNVESSEGSGNPIFASQPKNQDILAAALADTDVFQQEQSISHSSSKVTQSQQSPSSALYPMNVGNVLETNTMNSPIMTPLEMPRTNGKKITDGADILSQVPKNVDLPITITDPNISQTVAQQQVSLMAGELQANLELPLAIQDPTMSVTSSDMNSPNFVYSLPSLDDAESDINQKSFTGSISMPLLTEEPEIPLVETSSVLVTTSISTTESEDIDISPSNEDVESDLKKCTEVKKHEKEHFMVTDSMCAIRGGICNSLSEPPPDMFDFSVGNQNFDSNEKTDETIISTENSGTNSDVSNTLMEQDSNDMDKTIGSTSSTEDRKPEMSLFMVNTNSEVTSPSTTTDDSCEIPVQPEIVTDLTSKNFDENGDANFETKDDFAESGDV